LDTVKDANEYSLVPTAGGVGPPDVLFYDAVTANDLYWHINILKPLINADSG